MNKLVILSLIVTVFGSTQAMANTHSDNTLISSENPMCNMNLPLEIPMKVISEYPGLHELVNQSNDQFSDSDLTYMCQYIYIRDLNPNAPDENGNIPLHIAIVNINYKAVRVLMESGADPTLPNNDGLTPLDIAKVITQRHLDITKTIKRYDERLFGSKIFFREVEELQERIDLIIADMSKRLNYKWSSLGWKLFK